VTLERLPHSAIPEIAAFLNRVWGDAFQSTGCPLFECDFLNWVYGGPDAGRTALVGARKDRRLVAFKAMVPRALTVKGATYQTYIGTHLAIDPTLALSDRLAVLPIGDQLWLTDALCPRAEMSVTFFDAQKPLAKRTADRVASQGLTRVVRSFPQMVVVEALLARAPVASVVRHARADESAALAALASASSRAASMSVIWTAKRVEHHWFGAPDAEVFVCEEAATLTGACAVYRLPTRKAGSTFTVAIVEALFAASAPEGLALLRAAVEYGKRIGARGVVVENATWLDQPRDWGLAPSGRQMQLAVSSRHPIDVGSSWRLDVK
jgi:hypothetical protein